MDSLYSSDGDPCRNLRQLLRSICLRRITQNQSNLTATYGLIALRFSPTERSLCDKILEQAKMDIDMLVSTSSSIQNYTKLFTVVLRLRMLCNLGQFCKGLGSSPYSVDMPQTWPPIDFEPGSDLGCDFCQNEESLDLIKDHTFCPSCSRVLPNIASAASDGILECPRPTEICSPQTPHLSNEPGGVTRPPAIRSEQSFLEVGMSAEGYPTKLLAVAQNLRDNISCSKRSVHITAPYFSACR